MEKIQYFMMAAFLFAITVTFWKLYLLLPNKPLEDDDTTPEAVEALTGLLHDALMDAGETATPRQLHDAMRRHPRFDPERFWRLNENRVLQLLRRSYLLEGAADIPDLARLLKAKRTAP